MKTAHTLQEFLEPESPHQISANGNFFYSGNHIVKLWEQYIKSYDSNIGFFTENKDIVNTIFNGLAQNFETAIVVNNDNTLYKNKDRNSITLCGEIDYQGDSAKKNIQS